MKKTFIFIIVLYALITGCLYILAPLIHWLIGVSSHNYRVIITVVALIIVTIGIIFILKSNKKFKKVSICLICAAICIFASQVKQAFYTEGKYFATDGHDIIVSHKDGGYSVKNSLGSDLLPKKFDEVIFIDDTDYVITLDTGRITSGQPGQINTYRIKADSLLLIKVNFALFNYTNILDSESETVYDLLKYSYGGNPIYINSISEDNVKNIKIQFSLGENVFVTEDESEEKAVNHQASNIDDYASPSINTKRSYEEIGSINVYFFVHSRNHSDRPEPGWKLYAKQFNSDIFYYIKKDDSNDNYYLVSKCDFSYDGYTFNAVAGDGYYYFNVPAWPQSEAKSENDSDSDNQGNINESYHQTHDPQPFEVFVPCGACNGSGICQSCNGTGQNLSYMSGYMQCGSCGGFGKCRWCGGRGGEKHIEYR